MRQEITIEKRREYRRRHSDKKAAAGLCRCGRVPTVGLKSCQRCLDESRKRDVGKSARRREKGLCLLCGKVPTWGNKCDSCRLTARAYLQRNKRKVMEAYGGKCDCCGISELPFLNIDHIGGGGNKHRREVRTGAIYKWLLDRNCPEGFRVLCFNCNLAIHQCGVCPHKDPDASPLNKRSTANG